MPSIQYRMPRHLENIRLIVNTSYLGIYIFFLAKNQPQQAQEQNRAGRPTGTTCLIGNTDIWDALSNPLPPPPVPLGRQNIPDGCMIYHSFPNIKNPACNSPPTSSAASAPPDHCFWHCLHVFTSAPNPCSTAPPYYTPPPSHPAPSAYHPPYPLTQKNLLLILTRHHGYTLFYCLFLGGGQVPLWIYEVC